MAFKVVLLPIHGMGNISKQEFGEEIKRLKADLSAYIDLNEVFIPEFGVFYSDITQENEDKYWNALPGRLKTGVRGKMRRFLLSGLSDAVALMHEDGEEFAEILECTINQIEEEHGYLPIVILAHSLGGTLLLQMMLNDVVECDSEFFGYTGILEYLDTIITTGCNIPLAYSGFSHVNYCQCPRWVNLYDADDLLGYPLKPLGALFTDEKDGISFETVEDIEVSVGGVSGWTPASHSNYWTSKDVLDVIVGELTRICTTV